MKIQEPESIAALVLSCVNSVNEQIKRLAESVDGISKNVAEMTLSIALSKDRYEQVQITLQEKSKAIEKLELDVKNMGNDQIYNSITRKAIWGTVVLIVAGLLTMLLQSFKIS